MAYGFEIYDSSGRLEFSSTESTNGGVFYGQFTLPVTTTFNTWKYIRFDNSYTNSEVYSGTLPDFKGRTLYFIILTQGTHEIQSGVYGTDLYNVWPEVKYREPSGITQRGTSRILVFIR